MFLLPGFIGRNLLQTDNVSEPIRQSDDTVRVDPSDSFKKYRGGYNITNKHYWSSTIFTGIYGYCIGVLLLLCGLVYGGFLLASIYCGKSRKSGKLRKRTPCYSQCYLWHIIVVISFTILAIAASGLVLGGNAKFHSKAKTVVNIIINTANQASKTIYNTTGAMNGIATNLETSNGNSDTSSFLTSTSEKLDVQAANIQRQAEKNRRLINNGLRIVYIITTVIISLNLVAVIALSVSGMLRFRRALRLFIILCWFLTVLCWLFFGIYFFLEKFSGDTCTALENFQQNPNNNSLSSILPCDELLSAKSILFDVSAKIYNLVNEVNTNLSVLQATSYPNLVSVCNPFSAPPEYNYQPDNCPANTVRIGDIPKVLKVFTCSDPNNGTCENELISSSNYKTVESYSNSVQSLLNAYPGMESLLECQSVKDAFSEILLKHCKPLKRNVQMVWVSMVFLSMIMVFLVLTWIAQANHEQKHHFSDGSVKPNLATANMLDAGAAKEVNSDTNSSVV
uniref:Transmembrane protein n=1 Tax=Fagus sylvatica TaxID=28930 RepID=A0A2N9J1I8_FAGSY